MCVLLCKYGHTSHVDIRLDRKINMNSVEEAIRHSHIHVVKLFPIGYLNIGTFLSSCIFTIVIVVDMMILPQLLL